MIAQIVRVAKTEILEQRRQPWMIVVITMNYLLFALLFLGMGLLFELLDSNPQIAELVMAQNPEAKAVLGGAGLEQLIARMVMTFESSLLAMPFAIVAISCGYSVLHDRKSGALPFLMLAPLSRLELITGKVVGALAVPMVVHLAVTGPVCLVVGSLDVMEPLAGVIGWSLAWWVAFLAAVPTGGLFVGALSTVISGLSNDARGSFQFINFFMAIVSVVGGFVVYAAIETGVVSAVALTIAFFFAAVTILFLGSRLISRDLS